MPFCTQCGGTVQTSDVFCAGCGAKQDGASPQKRSDFLATLDEKTASVLCYIPMIGWIASIVVLASERFRASRNVRFHAFQGLYIFVLWLFVDWVFDPMMRFSPALRWVGGLLKAAVVCGWVFMIVKTSQNEVIRLPILGELAERSVTEQR
jgi:uncharacterized membrane protein